MSQTLAQNVIEIHKTSTATGGGTGNLGHISNNNSHTDSSNTLTKQQSYDAKTTSKQNDNSKKDIKLETQEQR